MRREAEDDLAARWLGALRVTMGAHEASAALRDAALAEALAKWTVALTRVVVAT